MAKIQISNLDNTNKLLATVVKSATDLVSIDGWYGPWNNMEDFENAISKISSRKNIGVVTIAIWNDDKTSVVEYWNPDATKNFVMKSSESSGDYNELSNKIENLETLMNKYEERFADIDGELSLNYLGLDDVD